MPGDIPKAGKMVQTLQIAQTATDRKFMGKTRREHHYSNNLLAHVKLPTSFQSTGSKCEVLHSLGAGNLKDHLFNYVSAQSRGYSQEDLLSATLLATIQSMVTCERTFSIMVRASAASYKAWLRGHLDDISEERGVKMASSCAVMSW